MTDIEVLNVLGIEDFRHMTKEKVISFASLLDQMDPLVAEKALEQFPNFANAIISLALDYKETLCVCASSNNEIAKSAINACQSVINCLSDQLGETQTFDEKKYYMSVMKEMAEIVAKISENTQNNNNKLLDKAGLALLFFGGVLLCALGFKGNFSPLLAR